MAGPNLTGLTAITNILKCMRLNRKYVKKNLVLNNFLEVNKCPEEIEMNAHFTCAQSLMGNHLVQQP